MGSLMSEDPNTWTRNHSARGSPPSPSLRVNWLAKPAEQGNPQTGYEVFSFSLSSTTSASWMVSEPFPI